MPNLKLGKRQLISAFAVSIIGQYFIGSRIEDLPSTKRDAQSLDSLIIETVTNLESAKKIGKYILDDNKSTLTLTALVDKLSTKLCPESRNPKETIKCTTRGELREKVSQAIKRDYENRNVVDVDGWVLTETEADLYVLTELKSRSGA